MSCQECNDCLKITGANIKEIEILTGLDSSGCETMEMPSTFLCKTLKKFRSTSTAFIGNSEEFLTKDCEYKKIDFTGVVAHNRLTQLPSGNSSNSAFFLSRDGYWRPINLCDIGLPSSGATLFIGDTDKVLTSGCNYRSIDFTGVVAHNRLIQLPSAAANSSTEYLAKDGTWKPINLCDTNRPTTSGYLAVIDSNGCITKAPAPVCYNKTVLQTLPQSPSTGLISSIINYNDKQWDSLNNVTTGANWAYTAPVSGVYHVSASVVIKPVLDTTAISDPTPNSQISVYVNGQYRSKLAQENTSIKWPKVDGVDFATQDLYHLFGGRDIKLNAGDRLDIRVSSSLTFTRAVDIWDDASMSSAFGGAPVNDNHVSIHYVGLS